MLRWTRLNGHLHEITNEDLHADGPTIDGRQKTGVMQLTDELFAVELILYFWHEVDRSPLRACVFHSAERAAHMAEREREDWCMRLSLNPRSHRRRPSSVRPLQSTLTVAVKRFFPEISLQSLDKIQPRSIHVILI
jgi:hypothetical protein